MENEMVFLTTDDVVSALGALVFAMARRLPAAERKLMAEDLGRLARAEKCEGRGASATLLTELQRAAALTS